MFRKEFIWFFFFLMDDLNTWSNWCLIADRKEKSNWYCLYWYFLCCYVSYRTRITGCPANHLDRLPSQNWGLLILSIIIFLNSSKSIILGKSQSQIYPLWYIQTAHSRLLVLNNKWYILIPFSTVSPFPKNCIFVPLLIVYTGCILIQTGVHLHTITCFVVQTLNCVWRINT